MKLWKKAEEKRSCSPSIKSSINDIENEECMLVLGSGCTKCKQLEEVVRKAIQETKESIGVRHVHDVIEIASYGVMSTPALVYKGKVVSCGKVLTYQEVIDIIERNR
ncbi:MAG: thioredoxin family protein [Longicatena sp.]